MCLGLSWWDMDILFAAIISSDFSFYWADDHGRLLFSFFFPFLFLFFFFDSFSWGGFRANEITKYP